MRPARPLRAWPDAGGRGRRGGVALETSPKRDSTALREHISYCQQSSLSRRERETEKRGEGGSNRKFWEMKKHGYHG